MEVLLSLLGHEVIAEGEWRPCGTKGFFGDIKRKTKTARGYCKVKPEPGAKLICESLMSNQDRAFCKVKQEFSGIDVILDNRDAVIAEKARNDIQDERIQALEHEVMVLMNHLPGHRD